MKRIAFGCDHVGFILKEDILAHLRILRSFQGSITTPISWHLAHVLLALSWQK